MGNNMPKSESSAAETAKNAPCIERGAEKISLYYCFSFTIKMGKGGSFLRFRKSHFITA